MTVAPGKTPVQRGETVASQSWAPSVWSFGNGKVQQVAGSDPLRRSITFMADPANTSRIYLVSSSTSQPSSGLALVPGAGFTMNTAGAVYAVCPAGDGSTLAVITETGSVC